MSFFPVLTCFFPGKISCGPFRWASNHCVVPPAELVGKQTCSTKAKRRPPTCKSYQDQRVTSLERLSSTQWDLKLPNVISPPF